MEIVHAFFQPDVAAKTVQIRIPQKSKDNLVWTLTNNGLFSVKSAYNKLMELKLSSQHDYGIEKSIWKRLWKLKNDSKIKLFLWKCLTDSVSTRGLSSITQFTRVQQWVISWFSTQSSANEDWIIQLSCALREVWKERCNVVFEQKKPNPISCIRRAQCLEKSIKADISNSKITSSTIPLLRDSHWKPPTDPFVTINFDASFKLCSKDCGLGLIIRNFAGTFQGAKCIYSNGNLNAEEAECIASLEAVRWEMNRHLEYIILETDSSNLAAAINGDDARGCWENLPIISDIKFYLNNFSSWKVRHDIIECNKVADTLAKFSRKNKVNNLWEESPPDFICSQLEEDLKDISLILPP
ncbi:uncharacterized protein LOC113359668 [Papaver somniferum]|uniref:uncharacterized protein LOC113359668 n=1 Tax=Papaver somniferum TaxID=3469 RepID=UPI000E700902|nr:uncharacterized protein LOC113359668 [Papaver somniferum]